MAFKFNPLTSQLDIVGNSSSGGGDVFGPVISTDNAIARYDGTTGKLIQNSSALVQNGGAVQSQGFVGRKEINDSILIPSKHYMLSSGVTIMAGGSITIESDSEMIII